ncbi:hypothetical protein BH09BAC5_BH09BAC5_19490 [soil metagenome]
MSRIISVFLIMLFLASCKSHEVGNSYLESKHHPSEKLNNEGKKANKKAHKDFLKTQKKNNKAIGKKGHIWSKKKKQYTN